MSENFCAYLASLFPPTSCADSDGFLCSGGDLHPLRLLSAYSLGIFPCFSRGDPILWWSPAPRCILPLHNFRLPRRSARLIKKRQYCLTLNKSFKDVIGSCAEHRVNSPGVWITPEMIDAYSRLHAMGYAHSIEAWHQGELAGGLYGIALGGAFFGESMFHRQPEASRAALAGLVALLRLRGASLLDCQQGSQHMLGMGAVMLDRRSFEFCLRNAVQLASESEQEADLPWQRWESTYTWSAENGWSADAVQ